MAILNAEAQVLQEAEKDPFLFGAEMRALVEETLTDCEAGNRRARKLDRVIVVQAILLMAVWRQHSITNVLATLLGIYPKLQGFAEASFYRARRAIGPFPLQLLFERCARRIHVASIDLWKDLRVLTMDGTSLNMPDEPENVRVFGKPKFKNPKGEGAGAYPQIKLVAIMCPILKAILHVMLDRHDGGERQKAIHLVKRLTIGDLLLFDSGFAGAPMFKACLDGGVRFIGRIAVSWKPKVLRQLGDGDWLVKVSGSKANSKIQLELRLIEFYVNGEWYRLMTDLTDPIIYPTKDIIRLYLTRWEEEIGFGYLKTRVAGPAFGTVALPLRSKSPELVLQETYALLTAYNAVCLRAQQAAQEARLSPDRISFVQILHFVRMEALGIETDGRFANLPIMRPRRPRSYPRALKARRQRYPDRRPNYGQTRWDRLVEPKAA